MDRFTISENLSSWIRAVSGAVGIMLFSAFLLRNNENEKNSTLIQVIKSNEMQNAKNLSPDETESINQLDAEIRNVQYRH